MSIRTERDEGRVVVHHGDRSGLALLLKRTVQACFIGWVAPRLALYFLARAVMGDRALSGASESIAQVPGLWGVYCRQAFYRFTLTECGRDVFIGWQSAFAMREARLAEQVYIGRRCSIGFATIGAKVMLADGVQILSGGREHGRGDGDESHQDKPQSYERVTVGEGAWIGANAVIMADVGAHAVVGAGAVVTRPVPDGAVAVGVPARVISTPDTAA